MRLACLLALGGLCLLISCAEEGGTGRAPDDPGMGDGGPVVEPDPMTNCPSSEPKVGETCGPDITDSSRCTFSLGECTAANGTVFTESADFCCRQGVWESCGGRSPCATSTVDAAESPGIVLPPDGGVAPDAAPDLPPDAAAD